MLCAADLHRAQILGPGVVALTGIGMSQIGRRLMKPPLALTVDACEQAVADAGLTLDDTDGLSSYPGGGNLSGFGEGGGTALALDRPGFHSSGPYADRLTEPRRRVDLMYGAIDALLTGSSPRRPSPRSASSPAGPESSPGPPCNSTAAPWRGRKGNRWTSPISHCCYCASSWGAP